MHKAKLGSIVFTDTEANSKLNISKESFTAH